MRDSTSGAALNGAGRCVGSPCLPMCAPRRVDERKHPVNVCHVDRVFLWWAMPDSN